MTDKVIRVGDVAEKIGISTASVWAKVNPKSRLFDESFPKPFKISANATGWLESEINEYIQTLAAQRQY